MRRKITLLCLALLGWCIAVQAQPVCGFDAAHQRLLNADPNYAAALQQSDAQWAQFNLQNSLIVNGAAGTVFEIPVVVHIMHTGGAIGTLYNPTDATITSMIDYLNKSWDATWPSYPSVTTGGVNMKVRFKLAARDTNCGSTTGIDRVNMSSNATYVANGVNSSNTTGLNDDVLKDYDRWPTTEYYNIWVVNKIDGADGTGTGTFVAGFAYLPPANYRYDGCIMLATQAVAGQITLPHEIGHSMGLYHVFRVSNTNQGGVGICPPNPSTATNGDLVADTEPMGQSNFNCPSGINACTGVAWANGQHNFMDYSNCQNRFTAGQQTRVSQIMGLYRLSNYTTSLGATPVSTGQFGGSPVAACSSITNSNPTNNFNFGPETVTLNDMTVSTSGFTGDGYRVYLNKSCTERPTALLIGHTYNLSVTCGTNPENIRVFIDFNNDGVFNTTTELIASANNVTSYSAPTGWTVPNPTGLVTCIPLRMRVMSDATSNTLMNPCGPMTYGQIEDYSVVIRPATATVSVSITANPSTSSCVGTPISFTATPNGTVSTVSYKWFVNNVYTGITTNPYTASTFANGDVVKVQMFYTTVGGCYQDSAFSNAITVSRTSSGAAGVSIALTSGTNPGCPGQTLTFTATAVNGGSAPNYDWKVNTVTVQSGASNTFTSATLTNGNSVTCVMTSSSTCISPISATSNAIVISQTTVVPSVSIALTAGSNPGCPGLPLTFTATPTNGGTAPTYQWRINGIAQPGATNPTFTTTSMLSGDNVSVVMVSNLACANPVTATSNSIVFTVAPINPSINNQLTTGSNPGCPGQLLTFTGTPTNGGSAPAFQWKKNGTNITGATNGTYTTTTLVAGDVITVTLVSNDPCASTAPVTSNSIVISFNTVSASVSIALSGGSTNPTCAGKIINFTATPVNGGSAPVYNWKKNGTPVGVAAVTYSSSAIANGDVITVDMTSSNQCAVPATSTSNSIAMTVIPVDTPRVTVTITKGSNPGCKDSLIEFTASTTPSTLTPTYTWQLNAVTVASGPVYSSVSLITNDVVVASIAMSGPGCRSTDNTSSSPITMIRNTTPPPPLVSLIGNMLVSNYPNVQWYGPGGLIPGATSQNYHPGAPGYYYCVATNSGCNSGPSNKLLISLLDIATYDLDGVSMYPNPTDGQLVIDWGNKTATVQIDIFNALGQHLKHDDTKNASRKVMDLSALANGNYIIVIRDEDGKVATSTITLKK